jgi:hypothetical protein
MESTCNAAEGGSGLILEIEVDVIAVVQWCVYFKFGLEFASWSALSE